MAQLTEGWWKNAWPSTPLPKNFDAMKQAIKQTKVTRRGLSVIEYRKDLHTILDLVEKLEKEADSQFKRNPLNKKKAKGELSDLSKLVTKELSLCKNVDKKPINVFKKPFGLHLKDRVRDDGPLIALGRMDIELNLMVGLVNELRDKNAESALNTALNKAFDRSVDRVAKHFDKALKIHNGILPQAVRRDLTRYFDDEANALGQEFRLIPGDVLRKIGITERMAREYGLNKVASIATGAAGTGLAAAGVAVPGTTALALVGVARSLVSLLDEIKSVSLKVETKMKDVATDLRQMRVAFGVAKGKAEKLSSEEKFTEMTFSTLNTILGRDMFATLKSTSDKVKDIEGHMAYLVNRAHKAQVLVAKLSDQQDALVKKIATNVGQDKIKSLIELNKLNKHMPALFEAAYAQIARVNAADDALADVRRQVKLIKQRGVTMKRCQAAVDIGITVLAAGGGCYDAAAHKDSRSVLIAIAAIYNDTADKLATHA